VIQRASFQDYALSTVFANLRHLTTYEDFLRRPIAKPCQQFNNRAVNIGLEQIFMALAFVGAAAWLAAAYNWLHFSWKLQDALNRKLVPSSLVRRRMSLVWMFAAGDIVPGTVHYRRNCKTALIVAASAWVAMLVVGGIHSYI